MKRSKKKKRAGFLKRQYAESWNYLKLSKDFVWIIILLFFIVALFAFIFPPPDFITQKILKMIEEILKKTEGMNSLELIRFIFLNNLQASSFGIVSGVFFGIYPIFSTLVNGYLIGFVSSLSVKEGGLLSLWALFPHGIFELPAVWISLGMGLKLGTFIFKKKKIESFKNYFLNSLRIFIFIVIPLLITAAIIEGVLIALLGN